MAAVSRFQRWRREWQTWTTRWWPYCVSEQVDEELPDRLAFRTVYVLGRPPWRAAFRCPCGCGDSVELSLIGTIRPAWKLHRDTAGRVTLSPSVWRQRGCNSHYFIEHGRVRWV
ncbi:DUF6527 family protein [Cognatilysobacter terrigena]|uniref:DUF6527 family protein n=1 Tax=Cognatilysobacter terrigena TaxID=2488749 RepID=UPI003CCC5E4B